LLGGLAALGAAGAAHADSLTLPFENGERPLVAYPQKRPLARLTTRPPQLETPFSVFADSLITPNDAFYVRYHLSDIPFDRLDPETFRLSVKGLVRTPLSLSLAELRAMEATELVAVNQCSGNGRGFSQPRVAGGQAGNGLMGNARWSGVPLKAVLARAGVMPGAVEVSFNGLDGPASPDPPDFVKSLPIEHADDGEVMLAWGMNGADLPVLNGYPLRLVVPGYYGTYWMKHLFEITVLDRPFTGFWMTGAYRIPDNDCACVAPGTAPAKTRPIGRFNVRSFITSVAEGGRIAADRPVTLRGIAFDGGSGIRGVRVSADGGHSWAEATLGRDLGRYSFRPWETTLTLSPGRHALMPQATSNAGEAQPTEPRWNPSGYTRNVVETVTVEAA
jgi:DMSO/TMAO reductase YedYZ molybdopterin-dependent catalytic subunit